MAFRRFSGRAAISSSTLTNPFIPIFFISKVLPEWNEHREKLVLDSHGKLIELCLKLGVEVRVPTHLNNNAQNGIML